MNNVDLTSRRNALKKAVKLLGGSALLPLTLRSSALSAAVLSVNDTTLSDISAYSRLIAVLSELIIPKTETPGAIEAGVPEYIELILSEWYEAAERKAFLSKLNLFDQMASKQGYKAFTQAPESVQTDLLHLLDKPEQYNVFDEFKSLTVFGYYTSEAATKELNYSLIPGAYRACVPLKEVGRTWLQKGL